MNITKSIKILSVFTATIVLIGIWLYQYDKRTINESVAGTEPQERIESSKFDNKHGFKNSYYIDVYNNNSNEQYKPQNLLLISDVSEPIYTEFAQIGSGGKVVMNVYYDYNRIAFKVPDQDFAEEYTFMIEDGDKLKIPVSFKREDLVADDKIHKLLITFTSAPDKHALAYDLPTNFFGMNGLYDVVYSSDFNNEVYKDDSKITLVTPTEHFAEKYEDLIMNTDYKNKEQRSRGGILKPNVRIDSQRGAPLKLMYNINKYQSDNCLLIVTVGFEPAVINGRGKYQVIQFDGTDGTANGEIEIATPNEPGSYEVIGYVVPDPFLKQHGAENIIKTSYRFTLVVK